MFQLQICPAFKNLFIFYILVINIDAFRRKKGRTVEMSKEHQGLNSKKVAIWISLLFKRQRKNQIQH